MASRNVLIGPRGIWAAEVLSLVAIPRLFKIEVVDSIMLLRPVSNWDPGVEA